ncbi:MAG: RNA polymerase subunit sigma, partial [Proteobacteria bacterium]|nr:RNA polymerase subunit sigma [Pseudomonadota bacterium]
MADRQRFEAEALVHLDAAYNLARWLLRAPADAEDAVQEALLRAYRAWDGRRGAQVKPWLLAIVRNCALTALGTRARAATRDGGDPGALLAEVAAPAEQGPAALAERAEVLGAVDAALERLA